MPANRRRRAATAPRERWVLLGKLLEGRRRELGHTYRSTFADASNVNSRMQADFESAAKKRVNRFMPGSFQLVANGYQVTEESMRAVLRGEMDYLVPAAPAALPAGPDGWRPPVADPAQRDADAPYVTPILDRLAELADAGVIDPSGAQVFPDDPDDAYAWDDPRTGGRFSVRDRAWFIADVRRRVADRSGNSGRGVTGA